MTTLITGLRSAASPAAGNGGAADPGSDRR
jgi:hypothetical protein